MRSTTTATLNDTQDGDEGPKDLPAWGRLIVKYTEGAAGSRGSLTALSSSATRYEKLAASYLAMLTFTATLLWLRVR